MTTSIQKPSFLRILLYLFTKYLTFFIVLGFFGHRYKTFVMGNTKSSDDIVIALFEYFLVILFTTVLLTMILFVPFYLLFKVKRMIYSFLTFMVVIIAEYF